MPNKQTVHVWEEDVIIPTYSVSLPEKNPIFIEKRAYQGSTGKVYPLPVTEKIADEKTDVCYRAVYLENDFLHVMILPELGGRIQRALDKTNNYDFVYYNPVIKPALVGLTGPWISGGIEFNWPQHHRPTTYSPIDFYTCENEDGSCSVYVSEIDKMYGTKGMACFTLYPDKAYIEIKGQLFNPTDTPQTFLWWANPAVPVNDHTFSVFPPDVHAVMDHGKRAVSTFPIATGEYYKYDYSAGVDISMYKNIKVPTSYMAAHSDYDFIGNYDSSIEAGLLHVADHHISPGKKQWTWGNADFGRSWDFNLADDGAPYIELMTGVFADNQPDFTWLKPQEEKNFVQYFMPYKGVGQVHNASRDMAIHFSVNQGKAEFRLYSSGVFSNVEINVMQFGQVVFCEKADFTPHTMQAFAFSTEALSEIGFFVSIRDENGRELLDYEPKEEQLAPVPDLAEALLSPDQLKTCEELYLAALHLEQYRHATSDPVDYYLEGLRRDPTDIRLNNGYGLHLLKCGQFAAARDHFQAAVKKQIWKNPNPYQGECYFNLALSYLYLDEDKKAIDAFYKSTWSHETQSAGFYHLAALAAKKKRYPEALRFAEQSILRNGHNMKARGLKTMLMKKCGQDIQSSIKENLAIDPLDLYHRREFIRKNPNAALGLGSLSLQQYLLLALDEMRAGFFDDAILTLDSCSDASPLKYYYQGYACHLAGNPTAARSFYEKAETCCPDYCFPNKIDEVNILQNAMDCLVCAPLAKHLLGNLFYDKKQCEQATSLWEESWSENPTHAMTARNLAISYYNKKQDTTKALEMMHCAFTIESDHSRFLMEYDQLCTRASIPIHTRLQLLEEHLTLVQDRDALYSEYITLLNNVGRYQDALSCLQNHRFHPWEGGEGKVSGQYRFALIQLAVAALKEGDPESALKMLFDTLEYPKNLGEGKLPNVQDNVSHYYIGCAYQASGDKEKAHQYWELASKGLDAPAMARYYNEQPSDTIYYQGLANQALGRENAARKNFHQLISFGNRHIFDTAAYDFFAVSLPELDVFAVDIQQRNTVYCRYLTALGEMGLGNHSKAKELFDQILSIQADHQGALAHQKLL